MLLPSLIDLGLANISLQLAVLLFVLTVPFYEGKSENEVPYFIATK
jgi:hypothetical protein